MPGECMTSTPRFSRFVGFWGGAEYPSPVVEKSLHAWSEMNSRKDRCTQQEGKGISALH
jgi:hypothetical protein